MPNPLVSICIPTYNGAQFIKEAMNSALEQTYDNLEIVVSDDASKDDTLKIIETYRPKANIPILIVHHEPKGIGANWNNCIRNAKGTYIKFLFQDDVLLPQCITEMVQIIESDKNTAIVASKREFIVEPFFLNDDTRGWVENMKDLQRTLNLDYKNGIGYLDNSLFKMDKFFESPYNKVGEPSTILFRKTLVDEIGFFREDMKQVLDYEFCYRVLPRYRIAIMESKLVKFRLHNLQATVKNKSNDIFFNDHQIWLFLIYKDYFKYLNWEKKKIFLRRYNKFVNTFYNTIDSIRKFISKLENKT